MNRLAPLAAWLPLLALFLGGCLLCIHWGFEGFFAIDQSIVWHGAARWMQGEVFISDIRTPNGFTPIVMQALLFKVMGMTWKTYVIHAGLMNGAFGVIVYLLLRRMEGPRWLSFAFAALSMLVFYAPMSTPFMDQHAYFFCIWAVLLAMNKQGLSSWRRRIEWGLLPVALLLAALSKQIPTAFFVPVVALVLVTSTARRHWIEAAASMGAGILVGLCIVCWWFPPWHMDAQLVRLCLWEMPSAVGNERWGTLGFHKPYGLVRQLLTDPYQALNHRKEFYRMLFMLLIISSCLVPLLLRMLPKLPKPAFRPLRHLPLLLLVQLAGGLSLALTLNDKENSIPYVYVTLGGISAVIWSVGKAWDGNRIARCVSAGLVLFLLGNSLWDAVGFWRLALEPRKVNDFTWGEYGSSNSRMEPSTIAELKGLHPQGPNVYGHHQIDSLVIHLRQAKKSFLLWSDYSLVYELCGQRDPLPWLWLHPGLTMPGPASPYLHETDSTLLSALRQSDLLVMDNPSSVTYMHADIKDYPQSNEWVHANTLDETVVGHFIVLKLKP